MSNFKILLNNGVRFVEINGVKYIASTFAEVTRTYNKKTDFTSFEEYYAYKFMTDAYFSARAVIKRKLETTGTEFYADLLHDLYIDYVRDCNANGYCDIIRELEITRDILNKELSKIVDSETVFLRDRISATIHDLHDLFESGDSQGNGHDLITCALEVLLRVYKEEGLMPDNDMTVTTKRGTKKIKVRTYASRAVDNYINALRRNLTEIENNTTENGDGDEEAEAINNIAYIETAFDNIDNLEDFFKECDIVDDIDKDICRCLYVGYNQTETAEKLQVKRLTVFRHIQKISDKIRAHYSV